MSEPTGSLNSTNNQTNVTNSVGAFDEIATIYDRRSSSRNDGTVLRLRWANELMPANLAYMSGLAARGGASPWHFEHSTRPATPAAGHSLPRAAQLDQAVKHI